RSAALQPRGCTRDRLACRLAFAWAWPRQSANPMSALSRENRAGFNLGVLISGRGTNLQSILDAIANGALDATVAVVISNRAGAPGLARAAAAGVETLVMDHREHPT